MKRSEDRILTTHVGSLPRPMELLEMYAAAERPASFDGRLRTAVGDVVRKQVEVGVDHVNDGEFGKPTEQTQTGYGHNTWARYIQGRLAGFEWIESEHSVRQSRDRSAFPEFYEQEGMPVAGGTAGTFKTWTCTGPISYQGHDDLRRDIENLTAALDGTPVAGAFLPVVTAAGCLGRYDNAYYESDEAFGWAIAEALKVEYDAIAAAGLVVQLDEPSVIGRWDFEPMLSLDEYRRLARTFVEMDNHALRDVSEEQVRIHLCYGGWNGPHSGDLPLADIIDVVLEIDACAYSIEASNPRHEHEWRIWEDRRLPEGKILMPGVVTHKTNVLEHPQVVADRIVRYAELVGRENVIACTDCGVGGRVETTLAWAKLQAMAEGAELASKRLWAR